MTPEQISEIAKQCGDDWDHTLKEDKEFLERFANAVIAAHMEGLLKDVGEPQKIEQTDQYGDAYGYTAEQVAAAVARQKAKASDNYEVLAKRITELETALQRIDTVAVFLPTFKVIHEGEVEAATRNVVEAIDSATKHIATLESTLKVAQDGLASIHTATACSYSNIQEVLHD